MKEFYKSWTIILNKIMMWVEIEWKLQGVEITSQVLPLPLPEFFAALLNAFTRLERPSQAGHTLLFPNSASNLYPQGWSLCCPQVTLIHPFVITTILPVGRMVRPSFWSNRPGCESWQSSARISLAPCPICQTQLSSTFN